jgi:acyl carrier protein
MEEIIKRLLAETIEADVNEVSWNRETDIINDIGIDSLQLVRFLMRLEEELNITIDYEALTFEDLATIGSLENFLSRFEQ